MSDHLDTQDAIIAAADMKLSLNRHKGDINTIDPEIAIELAKTELNEALEAIKSDDYEKFLIELGDAFNFIRAAGHSAIQSYRRRK